MSRALVVGAGIGGLASALALRRAGFEVTVAERAPEVREVGAGIAIWPNGGRALAALGVEVPGRELSGLTIRSFRNRALIQTPVSRFRERYGGGLRIVHRADLQSVLLEALGAGAVRLRSEAISYEQREDGVTLALAGGPALECDLLVGADGLRSAVRGRMLDDGPPRYLACTAWRAITDRAPAGLEPGQGLNWWGRGAEFGILPMDGGRFYWFGTANAPEGEADAQDGRRADVQRRFAGWPSPVRQAIDSTAADAILRNDIYDRPPARAWTSGRVALVGDAAHPMAPNAGQGACQALEDAVALGECLDPAGDIAAGLIEYQRRRLGRANRVVRQSRLSSRAVQSSSRLVCATRDAGARLLPSALMLRQLDAVAGTA